MATKNSSVSADSKKQHTFKTDRYYTPDVVELHNSPDDCWLSWNGYVYNLTKLVTANRGRTNNYLILGVLDVKFSLDLLNMCI